ncbi:MAG: NAD-dependent epimerase/dehydratase family protein [Catenulispora sp.]|nr:NAD-dependent epimerase/dehydratase family protein [Catenulispora sp.]
MRAVVTGAAGFVGSHLSERLLRDGHQVVGIDALTDYYDVRRKEANLAAVHATAAESGGTFRFHAEDLNTAPLKERLDCADCVFHLAGQPGVRRSWGADFTVYTRANIDATQALLEAAREVPTLRKLVYASSSSVYGDAESYPTAETLRPQPVSPYGVTKLAGEHLCELYRRSFGVPTASLRFFTVYGPRQRPDMAFRRLVQAAVRGGVFRLFGDGEQTRDFTYVADIVEGLIGAAAAEFTGVANVGGAHRVSMNDVLRVLAAVGAPVEPVRGPGQPGDVRDTGADITVAREGFGYAPRVSLQDGLAAMVAEERRLVALDELEVARS